MLLLGGGASDLSFHFPKRGFWFWADRLPNAMITPTVTTAATAALFCISDLLNKFVACLGRFSLPFDDFKTVSAVYVIARSYAAS